MFVRLDQLLRQTGRPELVVLNPRPSRLAGRGEHGQVGAVFQPAPRRIRQAVDRRFRRHRHDATRIIEAFGTRLRDQVELTTLTAELLAWHRA